MRRVPLAPRWLRVGIVAVVAGVVLVASVVRHAPGPGQALLGVGLDKWFHAVGYATLAATLGYALVPAGDRLTLRALAAVFLAAVAFGVGVELLQGRLAYRSMSAADALADAVGAALGTLPWRFLAGAGGASDATDASDPKALSPSTGNEGQ